MAILLLHTLFNSILQNVEGGSKKYHILASFAVFLKICISGLSFSGNNLGSRGTRHNMIKNSSFKLTSIFGGNKSTGSSIQGTLLL